MIARMPITMFDPAGVVKWAEITFYSDRFNPQTRELDEVSDRPCLTAEEATAIHAIFLRIAALDQEKQGSL